MDRSSKTYKIQAANGPTNSSTPGSFGGHKGLRIYGRLDCQSAARWIQKGYYVTNRVFFHSAQDAANLGYRPCGYCMKSDYRQWKAAQTQTTSRGTK